MAQATRLNLDSSSRYPEPGTAPRPNDDVLLRETLKYCSPSTYEAARGFRQTARPEYLPAILHGILLHYVEPDLRNHLRTLTDGRRLREDLGLDSLTMMEIVIRLEDVLLVSIRDDELRQIRTVGEIRALIERTLAAGGPVAQPPASARS